MPIEFYNADIAYSVKKKTELRTFILKEFKKTSKKPLSLSCVFCSDEYLLKINQDFLQHDYYTDIITFPLSETEKKISAEIYISIDRVRENAVQNKVGEDEELRRVIFHGVLHLCGYGDKTPAEQKNMRNKENEWLALFASFKKPK